MINHPRFVEGKLESAWRDFEKIKEDGLSKSVAIRPVPSLCLVFTRRDRSIGVSHFDLLGLMKQLLEFAKIKPAVN